MTITKMVIDKLYRILFKSKINIKNLKSENEKLHSQLEYLKRHSDISKLTPAGGLLRKYQIREVEFANEIINMLNSKGIFPFFDGGCLIGALRHKGFIPWDDDIDLGVMRSDFEKIKEIARKDYIWIEYSNENKNTSLETFTDEMLKTNDSYLFLQTPYCIHCYKGRSLMDSVNVEFFPYDYVADGISENDYLQYKDKVKKEVILSRPWKEIFEFYEKELDDGKVLTRSVTSRIVPGLGNFAQTQYGFHGFDNYSEVYPLGKLEFENQLISVPNIPDVHIKHIYNNWSAYPKDIGISSYMEAMKEYLSKKGSQINQDDFLF